MKWISYIHEHGIDMVPDEETDYHYMNAVDPLRRPVSNEDGELMACLCKPMVTYIDKYPTVYHRKMA